ncbi:hypothetical protein Mnod_2031 [Methylobacterium nodulans ORS 2060]|uniref:Uncharacterized protein n=1 Tax=Methylobacterium nodulans (strain LMG 21967 / CNCM I-2342 / ORS 2060) TaxID=460265 RepID=B8ITD1_METNO|nr:hypothetical protein Mnod_2031 [Methylobacterium nodulans ORS 2060]
MQPGSVSNLEFGTGKHSLPGYVGTGKHSLPGYETARRGGAERADDRAILDGPPEAPHPAGMAEG